MAETEQVSRRELTAKVNGVRAELRFSRRELRAEINDLRIQFAEFAAGQKFVDPTHLDTTAEINKESNDMEKPPQDPIEESIGEQFKVHMNKVDVCIVGNAAVEAVELPALASKRNENSNIMAIDSASCQAERTRFYKLEPNIYDLLVMPVRPLGSSIWVLLLLHYVLVFWLSTSIHQATARAGKELMGEIEDKLCTPRGDSWDCAQPILKRMADFKSLDKNMDGVWSLEEATSAGLLSQFRALHEAAVDSASSLRVMFPPVSGMPDFFCSLGLSAYTSYGPQIGWHEVVKPILDYLTEQGIHFQTTYFAEAHHLTDCIVAMAGHTHSAFVVYEGRNMSMSAVLCLADRVCQVYNKGTPAKSSEDEYRRSTGYYSFFPELIYEFLFENLLQPCFLIDSELCANAEIESDFLRMVPRWKELGSGERVQQCAVYVHEVCPHILGDQFQTFAKDVSESCGQRRYETAIVSDFTASRASFFNQSDLDVLCKDSDSALSVAMRQLAEISPHSERMLEMLGKYGLLPTTCQQIAEMGWCHDNMPLANMQPDGSIKVIEFGRFMAESCPKSCCQEAPGFEELTSTVTPLGCDTQCYHAHEPNHQRFNENIIHYTCFGVGCIFYDFQEEQFGQLRISASAGWYARDHSSRVVIYSNRSLWVNVIRVFAGGGEDCPRDNLQIDGVRVCQENRQQHKQVFVPMRSRVSFEIVFHVSLFSFCPHTRLGTSDECTWEVVIVDAGERNQATISQVTFEQQIRLGMSPQGVRSWDYVSFFALILAVWIFFMWQELTKIIQLALYLWECPDVGKVRRRLCFLVTVGLPRLIIWGRVLRVGVILILVSSEFVEIVLNSVALGFILDIDEIIFSVMVPVHVQDALLFLDKFRWLSTRGSIKYLGDMQVILKAVMLLLLVSGLVTWEYYSPSGYLAAAQQVDCVCALQGTHCSSGVLN